MAEVSASARILRLARRFGSVARQDVLAAGIHTQALSRLVRAGELERVAPGQYRLPNAPVTEHHAFAIVAAAAPKSAICLLSALNFHRIGTQVPHAVWIAIDRRARRPTLRYPPLQVSRFGGPALTEGIEARAVEGQSVRVYCLAKTIADLFKYRNKIGLDVALEALQEAWRTRRVTMSAIHRYARICRVERVMRPYLEAQVA
ncbi:MAG: type IV toxin-antitoxin system AbiEi family antitoxin domain-containing protein [Steroidobacteraceae bacterium]